MDDSVIENLLRLNQQLLDSIMQADWGTYAELCDETLTCFEPEAKGHLVEGLPFHHFYFALHNDDAPEETNELLRGPEFEPPMIQVTMSSPHVRLMNDSAIISYVRLVQMLDPNGSPITKATEETRVWQLIDGKWKHVHFHRSFPS
jgi:hypothetical protein